MSVNEMTFEDLAAVIGEIQGQATNGEAVAPVDTASFVSVGQNLLKCGYDPLNTAISQVLGRTIFANRPYTAKFPALMRTAQQWGSITRKISMIDTDVEEDQRFKLVDDGSIDMYKVLKPKAYQENFYGGGQYQKRTTIYKDQLDNAFNSPDDFAGFIGYVMQNASDQLESVHENLSRACLCNLIAGVYKAGNANQVVHLLAEYNAATGKTLDKTTVNAPENFPAFIQWAYARVETVSKMLEERSSIYHLNPAIGKIQRHTPQARQVVYMSTGRQAEIASRVLADTYHDNYLKRAKVETVNFWQNILSPDEIKVTPAYLDVATGGIKTEEAPVDITGIFGAILDEDAAGLVTINQWAAATPLNASGGYTNYFWHFTDRYFNSFTENAVIFLLD